MSDSGFDLCALLRRIRRAADLSQRELAERLGISKSAVAAAETGVSGLDARAVAAAAALAGLRLALLDGNGREVLGMDPDAVRDRAGRRFPAHLDTVLSEERAWRWDHRPLLRRPTYTFDRRSPWDPPESRATENRPDDHLLPEPGDAPQDRAAARRAELARQAREERERRFLAGELRGRGDALTCTCPPACDELDDWSGRPVHADGCPCGCDLG